MHISTFTGLPVQPEAHHHPLHLIWPGGVSVAMQHFWDTRWTRSSADWATGVSGCHLLHPGFVPCENRGCQYAKWADLRGPYGSLFKGEEVQIHKWLKRGATYPGSQWLRGPHTAHRAECQAEEIQRWRWGGGIHTTIASHKTGNVVPSASPLQPFLKVCTST